MTDDERADPEVQWTLGAQIPLADGTQSLEMVRPLMPEELERLNGAAALLRRVSATTEYARAVGLMKALEERHDALAGRDRPPPSAALGPLTKSIAALCAALADVPAALVDQARGDLDVDRAEGLAQRVATMTASDAWRLALALSAVIGDRRANLAIDEGWLRLTAAGLDVLGRAADVGHPPDEPVLTRLRAALLLAQDMLGHRLLAYRELIDKQGLVVRLLAAEVQLGTPTLMAITPLESTADEDRQNISMSPLPLDHDAVLQVAVRNAEQLLRVKDATVEHPDAAAEHGGEDDRLAREQADEGDAGGYDADEADAGEQADEHDDGEADELADDVANVGELADPDAEPIPRLAPIDDQLLFEHARTLPGEAERAWSTALASLGQDDAHAELAARWQAFLTTIARRAQGQAQELTAAGIDARITLPDDPAVLTVLTLDEDPRAQWLAASVGQMAGLQAVLKAYRTVLDGRRDEPAFGEPDAPQWWESGAFGALRARAAALERLTNEVDAADARLLGNDDTPPAVPVGGAWTARLQLADDAQARGDWEAAVVHLWLALRQRAAQLASISPASVPDTFEERLAAEPDLGGYGPALKLLARVARRILSGDPPPLGLSVVLANLLTPRIRVLCTSLSDVLPRAATERGASTGA